MMNFDLPSKSNLAALKALRHKALRKAASELDARGVSIEAVPRSRKASR
jgi:hypothetical protein